MQLSERELSILDRMLEEYKRSVRRKRSWRASEQVASMTEAQRLVTKIKDSTGAPFTVPESMR